MSGTFKVARRKNEVILSIEGDFVFNMNTAFRKATDPLKNQEEADIYIIDLAKVGRIDSSALGMLMIFFGAMGGDREKMKIINVSEPVRRILDVALFHEWFQIEK